MKPTTVYFRRRRKRRRIQDILDREAAIDMLTEIGYTKIKANNLYNKYQDSGKLHELHEFISEKMNERA